MSCVNWEKQLGKTKKKTDTNLQKVSVTNRIIDKQVKNTTTLYNIIVQYI